MSKIVKNYINGKWVESKSGNLLDVENPSTGEILAQVPLSTVAEANLAVDAARAAFPAWSQTPVTKRAEYMYEFLHLLKINEEKISRILTAEMGKSLPDSRAEMKRVFQNTEAACGVPILQQGDKLIGCANPACCNQTRCDSVLRLSWLVGLVPCSKSKCRQRT